MHRRSLLGTLAALGTAGCLGLASGNDDGKPLLVRAMRARGNETEYECNFSESFVEQYPALRESLQEATDKPVHEWATTGVSEERGHRVSDAISAQCTPTGGIVNYRGEQFFVSVTPRGTSTVGLDHGHDGNGTDGG